MRTQTNARGLRINQSHPQATLTDHEVDLMRELHEDGMSVANLADKFEVSRQHAWRVVTCRARAQHQGL